MAKKKKKHGKVEARQARARIRFKPSMLFLIILLTFAVCFVLYLISAAAQEDYWQTEIVASMEREEASGSAGKSGKRAPEVCAAPRPRRSTYGTSALPIWRQERIRWRI